MNQLLSFHSDPNVKDYYLKRVLGHQERDEIVQGIYWGNGKGGAVGCTIHGEDIIKYEVRLGIPIIIARLEDGIFNGLSNEEAKLFPYQFLSVIPVGVDLSKIWNQFAIYLLTDDKYGVINFIKNKSVPKKIVDLYQQDCQDVEMWDWVSKSVFRANNDATNALVKVGKGIALANEDYANAIEPLDYQHAACGAVNNSYLAEKAATAVVALACSKKYQWNKLEAIKKLLY